MSEYYFRDWNKRGENGLRAPQWSDKEIAYLVKHPNKRMKINIGETGKRTVADILDKNQYMKLTYDNISELAKKSDGLVGVYQLRMLKLNDAYDFARDLWWILLVKQIHGRSDNSDEIDEILITDPTDKYKEGIPITREDFRHMYPPKEDPDGYYIKKTSHPDIIRERLGAIKDNFNDSENRLSSMPYNLANTISEFTEDVNGPLYKSDKELRNTKAKHNKTDHDREAAMATVNAEIKNNRQNETSYNPMFRINGGKVKSRTKTKSKKRGKNKTSKKRRKNKTLKNRRKNKTLKNRRKNKTSKKRRKNV